MDYYVEIVEGILTCLEATKDNFGFIIKHYLAAPLNGKNVTQQPSRTHVHTQGQVP